MEVTTKTFKDNEIICLQNSPTNCLYVLRKGKIKVIVNSESNITEDLVHNNGKLVNTISGSNITIGEIGLILNQNRSASLVADGEVELDILSFDEKISLGQLIKHNPKIGNNILNTFITRLLSTARKVYNNVNVLAKKTEIVRKNFNYLNETEFEDENIEDLKQELLNSFNTNFEQISNYLLQHNNNFLDYKEVPTKENNFLNPKEMFLTDNGDDNNFYLMLKGEIKIFCNKIPVLKTNKDHSLFCDFSLLLPDKKPENYFTFVTEKDSKIKKIDKPTFFDMLKKEPFLYNYLLKIISPLLTNLNEIYNSLDYKIKVINDILENNESSLKNFYNELKNSEEKDKFKNSIDDFFNDIKSE